MRARPVPLVAAAAVALTVVAAGNPAAAHAAATSSYVSTQEAGTFYPPPHFSYYNRPTLAGTAFGGTERLFRSVTMSTADSTTVHPWVQTQYLDVNRPGSSWQTVQFAGTGAVHDRASVQNMITDDSGNLHIVDGVAYAKSAADAVAGHYWVAHRVSAAADHGAHFDLRWSRLELPRNANRLDKDGNPLADYPYQGIVSLDDGTWLMPVYGQGEVSLVASTDEGASWKTVSIVATGGVTESTVGLTHDGHLVVVVRLGIENSVTRNGLLGVLLARRSHDPVRGAGDLATVSWDKPKLDVPGDATYGGLPMGASPRLTAVGSDLMLTFGRPGNHVVFGTDGIHWSSTSHDGWHANQPNGIGSCHNTSQAQVPCDALGTSGYVGVAVTNPQHETGYWAFDACHVWSCVGGAGLTVPPGVSWPAGGTRQRISLVRFDVHPGQ